MRRRQFLSAAVAATFAAPAFRTAYSAELPSQIPDMSASTLSAAIRSRLVSCEEVMRAYLARIDRYNPVYNAIVSMRPHDECIALSKQADVDLSKGIYRGWMHGMPHAVKDLANAAGLPTSSGSTIFAGNIAQQDSLSIARIRNQGALFIGKTNAPEFGMGSQSYNSVFGVTGSACNPLLTAGGSSGGAGSALGTRMLPVADGSDLMGSLRNPGAFNNVIGLRPSQGRVPNGPGGDLFYQQMGTAGPMGRNSEDTIRLLTTMAGPDNRVPLSLRDLLPSSDDFRATSLNGLKIGWLGDYSGYLPMEPGVLEVCEANFANLTAQGARIEACRVNYDMARLWQTWLTLRHWTRHGMRDLYDDPKTKAQLKPEVIWEIEGAFGVSAETVYQAGIARADWFRSLTALFDDYDLLLLPTAQVFPFPKEVHWPTSINGHPMDTYHRWMEVVIGGTLAGLPVVNVPAGFDDQGRPMGLQVMGPFAADQQVMEFALAYDAVTNHLQHPNALDL